MLYAIIVIAIVKGYIMSQNELINDKISDEIIEAAERLACNVDIEKLTVRDVLRELNISNRVFYNRFHNIDEVLEIIYNNKIESVRVGIMATVDPEQDFFEQITNVAAMTLELSYKNKTGFNQYIFKNDSELNSNYQWWYDEIFKALEYARANELIKDVPVRAVSYSVWCFIRGFNADALGRGLSMEDALNAFRIGFGYFLDGLRK